MIDNTSMAGMQSILTQIRQFETRARGGAETALPGAGQALPAGGKKTDFAQMVKGAVDSVNALQHNSQTLATAFERGDDVPLTDVVLAMQKSSIAFEATLQIRNKIMKAYEDIKNMPV